MPELDERRRARGAAGEEFAARWLARAGYTLLARNYHCRGGELDLVARQGAEIVFIEVRTRRRGAMVTPAESVTARKQARVILAATHYLQRHTLEEQPWRIDVLALEVDASDRFCKVEHFQSVTI